MIVRILNIIAIASLLTACGPKVENIDYQNVQREAQNYDEQKLQLIAPNDIFKAIIASDEVALNDFINTDPEQLKQVNEKTGDNPLSLAIKLQNSKMVEILMAHTYGEDLLFKNTFGEGYLYLLAKYNMPHMIDELVAAYEKSLTLFDDFEFSKLDIINNNGERAIHVAASSEVVEVLTQYWYRGWLEYPYSNFLRFQDLEGNNFLHSAARDGRVGVLRWGVEKFCSKHVWEKSDNKIQSFMGKAFRVSVQSLQMVLPDRADYWVHLKNMVNWSNNEGNTPLLMAVKHRQFNALRVLSNCDWADFTIQNKLGQNALMMLLSQADKTKRASVQDKQFFDFLKDKRTRVLSFYYFQEDWVNETDKLGQSSLHKAAILKDSYFYDQLKLIGDIYLKDDKGQTPQILHSNRK